MNLKLRYFRYLSNTDYLNCIETVNTKVCQKRHIEIHFDRACDPLQCKNWASIVAHDLTNTEILIIQKENSSAVLDCIGQAPQTVNIPQSAIIEISTECSLQSSRITIGRISYTKFMWNVDSGAKFLIRDLSLIHI